MSARVGAVIRILVMGVAVSACSTGGPLAAEPTTTPGPTTAAEPTTATPTDSGLASPTPSAWPSPTAYPRPALGPDGYPSYGSATISVISPALPAVTIPLACDWRPGPAVQWWSALVRDNSGYYFPVVLAGEQVGLEFNPRGTGSDLFHIHRINFAGYVPGPRTGTVELVDVAADWASGTIRFDGLAPDPETAPPGPLPSPLAGWIRPLGGDPAMARLTGALTWLCEPAPPSLPTPAPIDSKEPAPIGSEEPGPPYWDAPPPVALVSGDQRRSGVTNCESYADLCGPETHALGVESIIRIPNGGMLRFELPAGCQFFRWSLEWVSQSEHERWRGLWPDTAEIVGAGETSDGPVLELAAPPAGDWSVSLKTDCGGQRGDFFRVVVD